MARHQVDPTARNIDSGDLACWLLFFLESHGATITLGPGQNIHVDLNTMLGLTADIVSRWAPTVTILLPEFREIFLARAACR